MNAIKKILNLALRLRSCFISIVPTEGNDNNNNTTTMNNKKSIKGELATIDGEFKQCKNFLVTVLSTLVQQSKSLHCK